VKPSQRFLIMVIGFKIIGAEGVWQAFMNVFAQERNVLRKFFGTSGCFATPKGNAWRCAMRMLNNDLTLCRLNLFNAPGRGAQKNNITARTLYREIFIECAHNVIFAF